MSRHQVNPNDEKKIDLYDSEGRLRITIDREIQAGPLKYRYLAHGNYNVAYRSEDGRWVLKAPLSGQQSIMDLPERSMRLWNLINPTLPARLICVPSGQVVAWVSPYIEGTAPSRKEIAKKILEIYDATGRIVADAFVTNNFIKTRNNEVICIDVGAAFLLERRPDRSPSPTSLQVWGDETQCDEKGQGKDGGHYISPIYRNVFRQYEKNADREVVFAIQALLTLQKLAPDFRLTACMPLSLMVQLAELYRDPRAPAIDGLNSILDTISHAVREAQSRKSSEKFRRLIEAAESEPKLKLRDVASQQAMLSPRGFCGSRRFEFSYTFAGKGVPTAEDREPVDPTDAALNSM